MGRIFTIVFLKVTVKCAGEVPVQGQDAGGQPEEEPGGQGQDGGDGQEAQCCTQVLK